MISKVPVHDASKRIQFSPEQIQQYFARINLPHSDRSSPAVFNQDAADSAEGLRLLSKIIKYQVACIPFESLDLHYSQHHMISLDPLHLFHKVVERNVGRGGYCMENSCLLETVLRSLGYKVMSTGARVNEAIQPVSQSKDWNGPKYDGWNHMVNIVTIANKKYLVDVGFSSNGPSFPVPLEDGFQAANVRGGAAGGHSFRLGREHIPDNTYRFDPAQMLWVYNVRFNDGMDWIPGYCFSEIEFLPNDFETMSYFVSKNLKSWFTYHVVALRFLMDENEELVGDITLFGNEIKERREGVSKDLCQISSEEDRINALERYLGIQLSVPEREGIKGMASMIL